MSNAQTISILLQGVIHGFQESIDTLCHSKYDSARYVRLEFTTIFDVYAATANALTVMHRVTVSTQFPMGKQEQVTAAMSITMASTELDSDPPGHVFHVPQSTH